MKVVDLTHFIYEDMPIYPGTEKPVMINGTTIENDGFLEKKITFFSHTGTHLDTPAHLIKGGKSLDHLDASHFFGQGVLIELFGNKKIIDVEELSLYEDKLKDADFAVIETGWSRFWGEEAYFKDFPVLSVSAAKWLADFGLKGVGVDTISVDPVDTVNYDVHKVFLERDIVIIENLTNLEKLKGESFMFSGLPLKLAGGDGSPVRAAAVIF